MGTRRREYPRLWDALLGECREGHRRLAGSDVGTEYRQILAFGAEGDATDPDPWERTVGDLVDPTRTASVIDVVNAVSKAVGDDAAGWSVERLLRMVATLQAEADERRQA